MRALKSILPFVIANIVQEDINLPIKVNHHNNYNKHNKPTKSRHKVKLARKANLKRINNHK